MLQDPQGYAPSPEATASLRARYAPTRIAAEYLAACRAAIAG
jgi:hypothetical protein